MEDNKGERTNTAPGRRNAGCKSLPSCEVLRDNGHTREEQAAKAKANCDSLGKQNLPVGSADTCHHQTKDHKESPNNK